jgi:putative transposase
MTRMRINAVYRKPSTSHRYPRPYSLSLSATRSDDHPFHSRVGGAHHVYSDDTWVRVCVSRSRMGESSSVGMAAFQYADHRLLSEGGSGCAHPDGIPDIFNSDQGCQFTSQEFTGLLKDQGIQIRIDGRGCWRDNVFVERLWKSIKLEEEEYLHAYETVSATQQGLERYLTCYNLTRPH